MIPIDREYAESVCEIKTMNNQLMAIGKIKEVTERYLKLYNRKKEFRIMDFGEALKVNIFNTSLGFKVVMGNVYTSTKSELSMINVSVIAEKERRHFFRVDMDIDAKLIYRKRGPSKEADIKVLDMSLSGLRFKSDLEFSEGAIVSVVIKLTPNGRGNGKEYTFPCEIVRIIPNEDQNMYQYGCQYMGDHEESSDALCSFLFKKQRESLNENRNL